MTVEVTGFPPSLDNVADGVDVKDAPTDRVREGVEERDRHGTFDGEKDPVLLGVAVFEGVLSAEPELEDVLVPVLVGVGVEVPVLVGESDFVEDEVGVFELLGVLLGVFDGLVPSERDAVGDGVFELVNDSVDDGVKLGVSDTVGVCVGEAVFE